MPRNCRQHRGDRIGRLVRIDLGEQLGVKSYSLASTGLGDYLGQNIIGCAMCTLDPTTPAAARATAAVARDATGEPMYPHPYLRRIAVTAGEYWRITREYPTIEDSSVTDHSHLVNQ